MGLRLSEVWLNTWDVNTTGHYIFEGLLKLKDTGVISNLVVASGGASLPYSSTQKCGIQFKGTQCS